MLSIWRRHAPLYITHMMTFSMMAAGPLLGGWRPHTIVLPGLMLPVWIASSVLWTERNGSEELLRTLPVTSREVVRAKFALLLAAVGVYWLIMSVFGLGMASARGVFGPYLVFASVSCVGSLAVGALCYMGIWFFGRGVMTVVIVLFLVTGAYIAVTVARAGALAGYTASQQPLISTFGALPAYVVGALLALGLMVYYGLGRAAVRVRDAGDAQSF
jgi:ABC-type transport system involved in multi-copper enzyme maturation permease subunit